jgi:hypothetical protein
MAGSLRVFSGGEGGALALTEADQGSAALRAYCEASEAKLDAVRAGTDSIIQLCVGAGGAPCARASPLPHAHTSLLHAPPPLTHPISVPALQL